ncbi:hypothetical protein BDR04DRAFT_1094835 [Suillus decipiens]|nr:hypothetical protein BDR04DRAFT_1094835 [Suillus decipiens]
MLLQHIKSVRWHPSKRRSNNQRTHLARLNHRTITIGREKENISPSPAPTIAEKRFRGERKRCNGHNATGHSEDEYDNE